MGGGGKDWSCLEQEKVAGFCEGGDELSGSTNDKEFLQ